MLPFIKLHSTTILGKFFRTSLAVRGPIQKYHQNGELLRLGKIYDKEVAQKDWLHSVLVRCILTVTTVSVLVNGPLGIISLRLFFNLTLTLQIIPECFASRKSPGCLGFPAGHILYCIANRHKIWPRIIVGSQANARWRSRQVGCGLDVGCCKSGVTIVVRMLVPVSICFQEKNRIQSSIWVIINIYQYFRCLNGFNMFQLILCKYPEVSIWVWMQFVCWSLAAPGVDSLSHELDSVKYDMGELKDLWGLWAPRSPWPRT